MSRALKSRLSCCMMPPPWIIQQKFFHGLLKRGVYIAPSAYETWFITDALTYEDLDFTINAIAETAKEL